MNKKLYRSRTDKVFAGVCGGLASYFDMDTTIVRIIVFAAVFFSGVGIVPYIIAAIIIPYRPSVMYEEDIKKQTRDEFDSSDW